MKSFLALSLLLSTSAVAAADAGVSCVEVEQRLAIAQRTLAACNDTTRRESTARERCQSELEQSEERLGVSSAKVEACVTQKEQLCQDVALQTASMLQGTMRNAGACVPPQTEAQLQALLTGWFSVSRSLAQLDEYATGSSDTLPRALGTSETERHLGRVLGSRTGTPLWNRRILVEAFKLTAPNTWARLKGQGAVALDAFFDSHGPLPEAFMAEANGDHPEPAGPAGTPLSAALKLTLTYLHLADCEARTNSSECGRARQLVELLDNTGPLIIRRRIDEMWATPCDALSADTVRAWLQDFPVSKKEKGLTTLAELSAAARSKLHRCYLADAAGDPSYRAWVASRLPQPSTLDARALPLVDDFAKFIRDGDGVDRCGRAVRAMQQLNNEGCSVERPEMLATIANWAHEVSHVEPAPQWQTCQRIATMMWSGQALHIPESPAEQVRIDDESESPVTKLRTACDERQGNSTRFESSVLLLAAIAKDVGEPVSASPWRLDPSGTKPLEKARLDGAEPYTSWVRHFISQETPCEALGLSKARCEVCRGVEPGSRYDCDINAELADSWNRHKRLTVGGALALVGLTIAFMWFLRVRRARRTFAGPMRTIRESLEGLGLKVTPDAWRLLLPERFDLLALELPKTPAWERWGTNAVAVLSAAPTALREADVNHAAAVALRENVRVVFLLHPDAAVPDLGAVRATLDWAARGGTRAVQVLPLALSRLAWATRDEDLLDLVEETTLRGNPFEVRGPVRSSSQFWNRERLVAGLLTESRAGHWVVVTGLRRFGKSSLALEVARRTTGPSAYVDLAGFHHEVSYGETPAVAVEAILRTLVTRLADSAAARFPAATVPAMPTGALDAPALATWLRALATACGTSSGTPPPPMMLVLDEVEQLLSAPPEKLGRALEVLATLTGRLRSAFSEPTSPHSGSTASVVLCAALHPLLWAPLSTLGGQSLMGSFPSICVPALDDDAAFSMMRGLGSRQGIRFEDDALGALVKASHGVPLLLRRLGTSVLELYDADRARQGSLGAVRIGIEGALEAIRREEAPGSPLRVWVESEIAQADSSAGVLLRALADGNRVPVASLQRLVETQVMERFTVTGLTAHLAPAELKRRAQEAASVMVRLLAESRLLEAHGDMTSPEAYSLPDGVLRRILKAPSPSPRGGAGRGEG
ncbi:MAG: ATP-binding protein [Archangium sp.]|nr:ATP-binding protein [Archangium sp.]MDP3153631.1 ATP-binding protein [Archangium sp.]MDP3576378.1 ATP-binding protein [Archangium sp.]